MPDNKRPCAEACRLLDRLRLQATDVHRLTEGLHENHLTRRVIPDRWSLKELVCHIRRMQQVFVQDRLEVVLTQDNPQLVAYSPEADPRFSEMVERPTAETITAYLEERQQLLDRLSALPPEAWQRTGRHPTYPHSDVCSLAEYLVHHEAHHIYQMFQRRALIAPLSA
jgi:hypothetical protein